MNSQQKKAFNVFMHQERRLKILNVVTTNYGYAVEAWNNNNSNVMVDISFDANGDIIIPDYKKLN